MPESMTLYHDFENKATLDRFSRVNGKRKFNHNVERIYSRDRERKYTRLEYFYCPSCELVIDDTEGK